VKLESHKKAELRMLCLLGIIGHNYFFLAAFLGAAFFAGAFFAGAFFAGAFFAGAFFAGAFFAGAFFAGAFFAIAIVFSFPVFWVLVVLLLIAGEKNFTLSQVFDSNLIIGCF